MTMRAPNDNSRRRYQYRLSGSIPLRRSLPETGDRYADDDIDEPWWEIMHIPPADGPIGDYLRAAGYAANGRLCIQPHNDSYMIYVANLREARRAYYYPENYR